MKIVTLAVIAYAGAPPTNLASSFGSGSFTTYSESSIWTLSNGQLIRKSYTSFQMLTLTFVYLSLLDRTRWLYVSYSRLLFDYCFNRRAAPISVAIFYHSGTSALLLAPVSTNGLPRVVRAFIP